MEEDNKNTDNMEEDNAVNGGGKHGTRRLAASFAAVFALTLCLIVSLLSWRARDTGVRRVFIFERGEVKSIGKPRQAMEVRFLVRDSAKGSVRAYVDDLVLGPITHGLNPLFAPGARADACFVRGGVLYVDLNDAVLNVNSHSSAIEMGIELLKKNVLRNFSDIKEVCVFVGGTEAYRY